MVTTGEAPHASVHGQVTSFHSSRRTFPNSEGERPRSPPTFPLSTSSLIWVFLAGTQERATSAAQREALLGRTEGWAGPPGWVI